jgi:hypothetical protein
MKAEKKTDKRTRKAKDEKLRGEAKKLLINAHPETMRIAIAVAHGVARNIECPDCGCKFDVKVGDQSNKEILKELIQQIEGKPKQPIDADIHAKVELDNTQLLRLYYQLMDFKKEREEAESIETVEAEFKAIPEPKLPEQVLAPPAPPIAFPDPEQEKPKPSEPKPIPVEIPDQYRVKE